MKQAGSQTLEVRLLRKFPGEDHGRQQYSQGTLWKGGGVNPFLWAEPAVGQRALTEASPAPAFPPEDITLPGSLHALARLPIFLWVLLSGSLDPTEPTLHQSCGNTLVG